jgi:peptide chain release factor 3
VARTRSSADTSRPPARRTFAIISHPDAGKTTLTEKLLLEGGAIHLAGEVKARGANAARAVGLDEDRAAARHFGHQLGDDVRAPRRQQHRFNLLDTPGHEDFSEDTYRTLTAVDSAVMVIDAAKGIEPQTRKLFEVCRLRNVPIITFVNKVDREGRDPFELLDEVADALALDVCPMSWPVGMGGTFEGIFDFATGKLRQPSGPSREFEGKAGQFSGIDDAGLETVLSADGLAKLREEGELAQAGYEPFDLAAYRMAT